MKLIITSLAIFFISLNYTVAQIPEIKWQKNLGGSLKDEAKCVQQTNDGGFILAGYALSNNGDVNGSHGDADVWIVKLNADGDVTWKKCYGGNDFDEARSIQQTSDGGYIIAGYTFSNNNGDVSGYHFGIGTEDYWIIKLDANGMMEWQRCLGGTNNDFANDIKQTSDGGYVVAGRAGSKDGDLRGSLTTSKYWIVKMGANGNEVWKKEYNFGGIGSTGDEAKSIQQTTDGGYIVGGKYFINSESGGVLKMDADGNEQWRLSVESKVVNCIQQTKDNGYILAGYQSGRFYWISKIDSAGTIEWEKTLDSKFYKAFSIQQTMNNGYIVAGTSWLRDYAVVKLDESGNTEWEKIFGGSAYDEAYSIRETGENKYVVAGYSYSNDGSVPANNGWSDYWIVKLESANKITGFAFYDLNANNVRDENESLFPGGKIVLQDNNHTLVHITDAETFDIPVDTGVIKTTFIPNSPYYQSAPSLHISAFPGFNMVDTVQFAMQPIPGKNDVRLTLFPLSMARPGFIVSYKIMYENPGTIDLANRTIQLIKDSRLNLVNTFPHYTLITGDTIKWNQVNLKAGDTASIMLSFIVAAPPVTSIGDTLISSASIYNNGDLAPENNNDTLKQIVTGSYDPNDKTENHAGLISLTNVSKGDWLTYTIRFQNTGTDTASNIIVRDTLDTSLDWNSIEMVAASHTYQLNISSGNACAWYFKDISLPDSNVNSAGSHGYIVYRVKAKRSLLAGSVVNNSASIYFDYNVPVQTNTEKTTVTNDLLLPLQFVSFSTSHFGKSNLLQWTTVEELNTERFEIQRSINARDFVSIGFVKAFNNDLAQHQYQYIDNLPEKGVNYYRLKVFDKDGQFTYSVMRNVNNGTNLDVMVYPNPVKDLLVLNFNTEKVTAVQIEIIGMNGKKLQTKKVQLTYGSSFQTLNTAFLSKGVYFVQCIFENGVTGTKFLKE